MDTKMDANIAVIMVSHNDLNEACLNSFIEARKRTNLKVTLVVVDNASKKYRANEFVSQFLDDAIVILRNGDFGYGRSVNRGAREIEAEYYFVLNPDTILVDEEIFNKLYDYMQKHPQVGLAGPKLMSFQGRLQETCRRWPAWYMPFVQRTGLKETRFGKKYLKEFLMQDFDHEIDLPVDWVQGSAMFVPNQVWHTVKGFDDRFWMYFEDVDLCRRVWLSGHRVVYLPGITLQHAHMRQSAQIRNLIVNLVKTKETRGHLASWAKYSIKWLGEQLPSHYIGK